MSVKQTSVKNILCSITARSIVNSRGDMAVQNVLPSWKGKAQGNEDDQ